MKILVIVLVLFGLLVSSGCQPGLTATPAQQQATVSPTDTSVTPAVPTQAGTPDRFERPMTELPEQIDPLETVPPVTGEVPDVHMDAILADLVQRSGVTAEQVTEVRSQAVVWNDGSLGCPKPGEMYTQALVNGYWVVLAVDGREYDYRVSDSGFFFLCENPAVRSFPKGTPVK